MSAAWERLFESRSPKADSAAAPAPSPAAGDKQGVLLYADFTDCLAEHKGHAFAGIAAVTVPWSIYKKTITPLVVGVIAGFAPDILYANWRCDDKYKTFKRHLEAVQAEYGLTQPQQPGASK